MIENEKIQIHAGAPDNGSTLHFKKQGSQKPEWSRQSSPLYLIIISSFLIDCLRPGIEVKTLQ